MPPETQDQTGVQSLPVVPVPPEKPSVGNDPMNDPNLKMQGIVNRRKAKTDATAKPEEKPKTLEKPDPPGDIRKLGSEIGKALGFNPEKPIKEPEKNEEPSDDGKKTETKTEKEPDKTKNQDEKPAADGKTIVKPRKTTTPASDPVKIAAAAATAAVKAIIPEQKKPEQSPQQPEDALKPDDLHEYAVAKYMAGMDPRFKDAPRIVLEHVRKAEAYASRWEQENKGRAFNPDDEEHNDFYERLQKPWSDHEFRNAEMEMAAERVEERKERATSRKIQELEQENARIALAPVVERTFTAAAAVLARKMGDGIHERIVKNTFEKFAEEDPVTADAMASAIGRIQPIIEAAILLDDPRSRFKFDPNNQAHAEWNRMLLEKESQMEGAPDEHGRTMVSRADYVSMTPAQRSRHWYLDVARFIEEMVNDSAESAKKMIDEENKRLEKFAASRGYVLNKVSQSPTVRPDKKPDEAQKDTAKPASPPSAGSSKIDERVDENPSVAKKLLDTTAGILFSR